MVLQRANNFDVPLLGMLKEIILPTKSPVELLKEKAVQLGCRNLTELPTATIDAILDPTDVRYPTRYDALSYVWGENGGDTSICCEGKSIGITKNCDEVLRQLRQHNEDRILWVDAICIDQNSEREKSKQVELMGHIYKLASAVIIWFGPSKLDNNTISVKALWSKRLRDTLPLTVSRSILGKYYVHFHDTVLKYFRHTRARTRNDTCHYTKSVVHSHLDLSRAIVTFRHCICKMGRV